VGLPHLHEHSDYDTEKATDLWHIDSLSSDLQQR
jgi:hypothetical protein